MNKRDRDQHLVSLGERVRGFGVSGGSNGNDWVPKTVKGKP